MGHGNRRKQSWNCARMTFLTTRRHFLGILASTLAWLPVPAMAQEDNRGERKRGGKGGRRRKDGEEYVLPPELAAFGVVVARAGACQRPVGHRERLGKGTDGRVFRIRHGIGQLWPQDQACSLFPPASRWSRSSTTFSPTPNTSTGCNIASRVKPRSTRGRSAAFTRNAPPAAPSRLAFKAIRTRNVPR